MFFGDSKIVMTLIIDIIIMYKLLYFFFLIFLEIFYENTLCKHWLKEAGRGEDMAPTADVPLAVRLSASEDELKNEIPTFKKKKIFDTSIGEPSGRETNIGRILRRPSRPDRPFGASVHTFLAYTAAAAAATGGDGRPRDRSRSPRRGSSWRWRRRRDPRAAAVSSSG